MSEYWNERMDDMFTTFIETIFPAREMEPPDGYFNDDEEEEYDDSDEEEGSET